MLTAFLQILQKIFQYTILLFATKTLQSPEFKKAFHRNEKLFSFQKGKYFKSIFTT